MKTPAALIALSLLLQSASPAWAQVKTGAAANAPVPAVTPVKPAAGPIFNFSVAPAPGLQAAPLPAPAIGAAAAAPAALPAASGGLAAPALPAFLPGAAPAAAVEIGAAAALPARAQAKTGRPGRRQPAGALPALSGIQSSFSQPGMRASDPDSRVELGARSFDGGGRFDARGPEGPAVEPAFEPPTVKAPAPAPHEAEESADGENKPRRPAIGGFQPAQKTALLAIDPAKAIYGTAKIVKDSEWSRAYWNEYKAGLEVDLQSRGQDIFGRPTTITSAVTKPIGKMDREDFRGLVPEYQLQIGVRELRKNLIADLEDTRKKWSPGDPQITPNTTVRVIKFKSYLELYREQHGRDAVPEVEKPEPRTPLVVKPEGKLKPLASFLPRAIFLDIDSLEGPVSQNVLSDIAKLQRTGVYLVAFSRKPYDAAGGMRDRLIRQMTAYQLSVLMPIRFAAITDDGAVISEQPHNGGLTPVDVQNFTLTEFEMLRDATQKAAEHAGLSSKGIREQAQGPLVEREDFFAKFRRDEAGGKKQEFQDPDPRVRFELRFPKSASAASFEQWLAAFRRQLAAQGLEPRIQVRTENGQRTVTVSKTTLEQSIDRLNQVLGDKFGLYLNPGDALVLSNDEKLMSAFPKSLDFAKTTGLKGAEMVENALGLMLGEHRENLDGDLAGSASRMASFSRDRRRYLSEQLIKVERDEQNINFFSGHVVHAAQDWLVWNLQNGRRPSKEEYERHLRERWNAGLREFKPVGLPPGHTGEDWLRESVQRGMSMYEIVLRIHDRGEILVGTEIPNFFVVKDYERRSGDLKRRYILHTIFDFVALRPIPGKPGHAQLVIYDFKTGPTKTRPKLNKDVQVLTYALFANQRWVGEKFPVPYLAGGKQYTIDSADITFIYSRKEQPTNITAWGLDSIRRKIIGTLNRIYAAEQKMLGNEPAKAKKTKKPAAPKKAGSRTVSKRK